MASENGLECAASVAATIIGVASDLQQSELESLCKDYLKFLGKSTIIDRHEKSKAAKKAQEKKVLELLPIVTTMTSTQLKNHSIRFGLEEEPSSLIQRQTWAFTAGAKTALFGAVAEVDSHDYEDVIGPEILHAPIADICIIQRGDPIPDGFLRLSRTPGNKKANLNSSSGGNHIFLCIKKDVTGDAVPITAFTVIFPDRNEFVPPGYFVVRRGKHACNLNTGTSSERIFLCFKKDKSCNPIIDIQIIIPSNKEEVPKNFSLIDKTPSGLQANLNTGTGGTKLYLCYRQSLTRLLCLINEEEIGPPGFDASPSRTLYRKRATTVSKSQHGLDSLLAAVSTGGAMATAVGGGGVGSSINSGGGVGSAFSRPDAHAVAEALAAARLTDSLVSNGSVGSGFGGRKTISHESLESDFGVPGATVASAATGDSDFRQRVNTWELLEGVDGDGDEGPDDDEGDEHSTEDMSINESRMHQLVVGLDGNIVPAGHRKALYPLLAALYVRHGGVAQTAIVGLERLLKDTDFYSAALASFPSSGLLTIVDLTVEAVCDRFDICLEGDTEVLLKFLGGLIRHSGGRFSATSQQRLFRCLSFLCNYFSSRTEWLLAGHPSPCTECGGEVPAFKTLKDLILVLAAQVEAVDVARMLPDSPKNEVDYSTKTEAQYVAHSFVYDFVEEIIDSVEVCRISELAQLAISKQSSSTSSSSFWQQISSLARRLFVEPPQRSAFVALCALTKLARQPVRTTDRGAAPRDLGSKLLALDALLEFCRNPGEKMRHSKVFGYQIRRLVVPCILVNMAYALTEHRVFSRLLKLITTLWKDWRVHVRIEFANLCEQLIIRVLGASPLKIRPVFQMIVLQEVVTWFDQPHLLVEMFVNFDMDGKFVSHWNVFSHLVSAVCAIARRTAMVTGAWDWRPTGQASPIETNGRPPVTIRDVNIYAIEEVARISKTLMDATGHAYLMSQDSDFRSRSSLSGWEDDYAFTRESSSPTGSPEPASGPAGRDDGGGGAEGEDDGVPSSPLAPGVLDRGSRRKMYGARFRRTVHQEAEDVLKQAIDIYTKKSSLKKAVQFLIGKQFLADNPQEIANFLRVYKNSFDPSAIGDFLGEGGANLSEEEYWGQIRFRYTRAVSFVELEMEPALRLYLTGCGFRLPGEAQKIDRFVEVFQKAYWQDNGGTQYCPFRYPDTVHLVTYATIMLNTDLHRSNDGKKKRKKMTKDEFINNLRGAEKGDNIDREYLARIYDNIAERPIVLEVQSSEAGGHKEPAAGAPGSTVTGSIATLGGSSVGAVSGNMGLNAHGTKMTAAEFSVVEERGFVAEIARDLRDSEDLLRSLSPFLYRFQLTGEDNVLSLDLISYMFETVWFHFNAITEALLSEIKFDVSVTVTALDILCYSLTSAIFLNTNIEKMAFANQLLIVQDLCRRSSKMRIFDLEDTSWFIAVEEVQPVGAMEVIATIHRLMVVIKDSLQRTANYELTRTVAAKIEKKAKVLENNTFFVRDGDLSKRNRSGRMDQYRFFLFSDHLIYCHQGLTGEYKVHEQLSLNELEASDVDDPLGCSLYIQHPTKSFVIVCESVQSKTFWLRDIRQTSHTCKKRHEAEAALHSRGRSRQPSIYSRIEDQQKQQIETLERSQRIHSPVRPVSVMHSIATDPPDPVTPSAERRTITPFSSGSKDDPASQEKQPASRASPTTSSSSSSSSSSSFSSSSSSSSSSSGSESKSAGLAKDVSAKPSAEDRQAMRREAIVQFNLCVAALPDNKLNTLFQAGTIFWKGMVESRGAVISDPDEGARMLRLYGLNKQGKSGPAPPLDPNAPAPPPEPTHISPPTGASSYRRRETTVSAEQQIEAWRQCGDISIEAAQREFLVTLFSIAPYWKYEQFL